MLMEKYLNEFKEKLKLEELKICLKIMNDGQRDFQTGTEEELVERD